jgi:hypothetical protein
MIHLITYDLNKAKDYTTLYRAIGSLGEAVRDPDLDSVWFLYTNLSAQQVSDHLLNYIDKDDRIIVTKLRQTEYGGWMMNTLWPWLQARV